MGKSLAHKILEAHLVEGQLMPGAEIAIRVDQTLTQDATGTLAYLEFESIGIPRVQTKLSISYVDHNMLQTGFENADDHRFLQTIAARYGVYFSRPGNGICHQVHLERFSAPGEVLLGSDSHTPTCGGAAMVAIGAGGLEVAVAMAGRPFFLIMPKILGVHLKGRLEPWVTAKDVILEMLRRLTVRGGVGKIIEYYGEGTKCLSVPERSTITNMGAELGAVTSLFPSDEQTRRYFRAQGREEIWKPLESDPDATYDEHMDIDLNKLEPLIAKPHSPDNVVRVTEVEGTHIDQVCIGSCTNSSFRDLMIVARLLDGKVVHPNVSMTVSPGSRQVLEMVSRASALDSLVAAGARILESACGPCIGMGQAPPSGGVSVRTFNRNFQGRSGTPDAAVYLAGPETCAASALAGAITDPRRLGEMPRFEWPEKFLIDDRMILAPSETPEAVEVIRGPNIQPLPVKGPLSEKLVGEVLLKVGDNITTDDILPAGARILPFRSNIPRISEFVFCRIDEEFAQRAQAKGGGIIVGGSNYGQGSSREHAALAPMNLGVVAILAKSFARIHRQNLINFGILPLTFAVEADYERIDQGDRLELPEVREHLEEGRPLVVRNVSKGIETPVRNDLTQRQRGILLAGGLLNQIKLGAGDSTRLAGSA